MTQAAPNNYSITSLGIDYLPKARNFLRQFYGDDFYGAEELYFNWQFLQVPCHWFEPIAAQGKMPVNAILDANDEILAIHVFIPYDVRTPWGGTHGVWDSEWLNGSGISGLGRLLAKHLLNHCDIYSSFGMNDLCDTGFRKIGLTVFDEIHRRVAILDRDELASQTAAAGYPIEARALPSACTLPDHHWHILETARTVPTSILNYYAETTPFGSSRSKEWMAWRYDRHPYIKYISLATDADGAHGVAVVRLESVVGSDVITCRMTEFLPMSGHERDLLEAVVSFARSKGALIVDYFTTSSVWADTFDATTCCRDFGVTANQRVPYMYQPLDFNQRNSINLAISTGGKAPTGVDLRTFHATKGDSDQDLLRSPKSAPAF